MYIYYKYCSKYISRKYLNHIVWRSGFSPFTVLFNTFFISYHLIVHSKVILKLLYFPSEWLSDCLLFYYYWTPTSRFNSFALLSATSSLYFSRRFFSSLSQRFSYSSFCERLGRIQESCSHKPVVQTLENLNLIVQHFIAYFKITHYGNYRSIPLSWRNQTLCTVMLEKLTKDTLWTIKGCHYRGVIHDNINWYLWVFTHPSTSQPQLSSTSVI